MEHVPGGGDDYVVEAQGAVGENGLALLVKAYAYAHVVALIGGIGILKDNIAPPEAPSSSSPRCLSTAPMCRDLTRLSSSSFVSARLEDAPGH